MNKNFLENHDKSCEMYDRLINSFQIKGRSGKQETQFPDSFGGTNIDSNGNLVVYQKGDINSRKTIKNQEGSEDIIFQSCEFSYNALLDTLNQLDSFFKSNPDSPLMSNWSTYGIITPQNRVVVELKDFNQEKIDEYKKVGLDNPAIIFKESQGDFIPHAALNVKPGQKIASALGIGSLGYRAKLGTKLGVVTAAHVIYLNDYLKVDTLNCAKCTKRQYSGKVDAAFCEMINTSWEGSNAIFGTSDTLTSIVSNPGPGTLINCRGAITPHSSGTIISTTVRINAGNTGTILEDMTTANYTSVNGDSGGIVYSIVAGQRYTVGINHGRAGTSAVFSKASNVNAALGITRY